MKHKNRIFSTALLCAVIGPVAYAQNDGDHPFTDGTGRTFLAPDAIVGGAIQPFNFTVGLTPSNAATLRVRGDQLPVTAAFGGGLCTFRTDVAQVQQQSWWMYRDANPMGRIWHNSNNRAFHFQSMVPVDVAQDRYSGAMVQNNNDDGLWVVQNGGMEGVRGFPHAAQVIDRRGYMALGSYAAFVTVPGTTDVRGPWSRLHLFHPVVGTRPYFAFRPQMRNGLTLTGNSDLAYMGHWYDHGETGAGTEVDDRSNIVIATSENALPVGTEHYWDNISFRFFSELDQADGPASTLEGLEMMRIQPVRLGPGQRVHGFVGVGDFLSGGVGPEERLDVMDRTVLIRSLIPDYQNNALDAVVVSDADGRLHWRDANTLGGSACEWTLLGPPGSNAHVGTAFPGNPGCPQEDRGVGIGTPMPKFKLHVRHDYAESNFFSGGILSEYSAQTTSGIGVMGLASLPPGAMGLNPFPLTGAVGIAADSRNSTGVEGIAVRSPWGAPNTASLIGVAGRAEGNDVAGRCVGVYGIASGGIGLSSNWAMYSEGRQFSSTSPTWWTPSDQGLKSSIEPYTDGLAKVLQLQPRSYTYDHVQYPFMHLPEAPQIGLIAQEVEEVFPDLVQEVYRPADVDSLGNEITPEMTFKAMQYGGLIPVLISAIKGQQDQIAAQNERLSTMEGSLAACCAAGSPTVPNDVFDGHGEKTLDPALERLLVIAPNPFPDHTTVYYTLERPGRAQLLVNSADGRHVQLLHEGMFPAGEHRHEWNAGGMAPGVYYVTLLLDGEPLVKRAVKL